MAGFLPNSCERLIYPSYHPKIKMREHGLFGVAVRDGSMWMWVGKCLWMLYAENYSSSQQSVFLLPSL